MQSAYWYLHFLVFRFRDFWNHRVLAFVLQGISESSEITRWGVVIVTWGVMNPFLWKGTHVLIKELAPLLLSIKLASLVNEVENGQRVFKLGRRFCLFNIGLIGIFEWRKRKAWLLGCCEVVSSKADNTTTIYGRNIIHPFIHPSIHSSIYYPSIYSLLLKDAENLGREVRYTMARSALYR